MFLTDRDVEILETLTLKVRLLTLPQIRRTWWPAATTPEKAVARLKELTFAGLLEPFEVLALPLLDLRAPLFRWRPGASDPDCAALASALKARWPAPPPRLTVVYVASRFAGNWLGGTGGRLHRGQETHDLHVAAVYLYFLKHKPPMAAAWVSEDRKGKAGFRIKDPDAFLEYPDGRPSEAVEFAAAYDQKRLGEFHAHCARNDLRYQLW
jgi:hypothetical protein